MTKSELIRLCIEGNKGAMGILYSTYSMRMMNIIRKYVSDKKASEDILHDGFIVIYTHLEKLKDENSLEFWMGSIMRNISLKYLERLDIFSTLEEDFDIIDVPETNEILSCEELDTIIEKLPEGYKTIFRLAVLENKSHKEISKILGIAPSTSASQLYHAKVLLRKLITEYQAKYYVLIILFVSIIYLCIEKSRDTNKPSLSTEPMIKFEQICNLTPANIQKNKDSQLSATQVQSKKNPNTACNHTVKKIVFNDTISTENQSDSCKNSSEYDTKYTIDSINGLLSIPQADGLLESESIYNEFETYKNRWNISIICSVATDNNTSSLSSNGDDIISTQPLQSDYHYDIPFTVGISLERRINTNLSLNTGLSFTYQKGHINYVLEDRQAQRTFSNYYLGFPIGIKYNMVGSKYFNLYISSRFGIDIPIKTEEQTTNPSYLNIPQQNKQTPQLFISNGIGASYRISENIGLYIEPSIKYYLNKSPEPSIWAGRRLEFNLPIGVRYSW